MATTTPNGTDRDATSPAAETLPTPGSPVPSGDAENRSLRSHASPEGNAVVDSPDAVYRMERSHASGESNRNERSHASGEPLTRRVKKAAEKVVVAALDAQAATHIDARELADLQLAYGDLRGAQQRLQRAQEQLNAEREAELACRGAANFVTARIRARYGLGPQDDVHPETGAISRAATEA